MRIFYSPISLDPYRSRGTFYPTPYQNITELFFFLFNVGEEKGIKKGSFREKGNEEVPEMLK
jgi:hypothetical protein